MTKIQELQLSINPVLLTQSGQKITVAKQN